MIVGAPAKLHRELTEQDLAAMRVNIDAYVRRGQVFRKGLTRIA